MQPTPTKQTCLPLSIAQPQYQINFDGQRETIKSADSNIEYPMLLFDGTRYLLVNGTALGLSFLYGPPVNISQELIVNTYQQIKHIKETLQIPTIVRLDEHPIDASSLLFFNRMTSDERIAVENASDFCHHFILRDFALAGCLNVYWCDACINNYKPTCIMWCSDVSTLESTILWGDVAHIKTHAVIITPRIMPHTTAFLAAAEKLRKQKIHIINESQIPQLKT